MPKEPETNVRISATVRRSVRDKLRFLADQRTRAGRPTSESRLWSEAGALYVQQQIDMPGSRENTSKKISEQVAKQAAELIALRNEVTELHTELMVQRKFLAQLNASLQPILERLKPRVNHGG